MKKRLIILGSSLLCCLSLNMLSQINKPDYRNPQTYEIGGITVEGTVDLDPTAIKLLSGLRVGDEVSVPGDDITQAVRKLWEQKLFEDVQIGYSGIQGHTIFLVITVKERPKLSRFFPHGMRKSEFDNIKEDLNLYKGKIITDNLLVNTKNVVKDYYVDKGFLNADVHLKVSDDSLNPGQKELHIYTDKGKHVRIERIVITGNTALREGQLKRALKETKEKSVFHPLDNLDKFVVNTVTGIFKPDSTAFMTELYDHFHDRLRIRIFKSSKYLQSNFESDKQALINKYKSMGYRDARIVRDSMIVLDGKRIALELEISEGGRYYFRNITFVGNVKHSTEELNRILGIKNGEVYNKEKLDTRLNMNPNGVDVSSLYMDDGYLFFNVTPVEVLVEGDSIDMELRVYEGPQARINKVTITGNTKTNDHVILREIRTKPGMLFSRADIIRTQRELAQLGYFDPEKLNVIPKPNPTDGTVDIEYVVVEKPSDQIELSGGWGGGRVVGTLGLTFTNFSINNFFKGSAWQPIPSGDGQHLSIRASSNGTYYQSMNMSFTEPWLGGKKPNALSISGYHSVQSNGETKWVRDSNNKLEHDSLGEKIANTNRAFIKITGLSVGLGARLKWPDDYFTAYTEANWQYYEIKDWYSFIFSNGISHNIFAKGTISRNSIDQPIYPRTGSQITLTLQATPPYSYFRPDTFYNNITPQDKYKFAEYYKLKFTSSWFTKIAGNLVLNSRVGFGFLGLYDKKTGPAPFERFYLGGSGLTGYSLDGREIIALRGYDDQSVSPVTGGTLISKYTLELRYPFSLNPNATIYGLAFAEAGNTWDSFTRYNPFAVKRSAGLGVRIFLPMFGLLGLDYGWRFDDTDRMTPLPDSRGQLHFTIGANLGEL